MKFLSQIALYTMTGLGLCHLLGFDSKTWSGFVCCLAACLLTDVLGRYCYGQTMHVSFDPKYKETTDELVKKIEELNKKE